MFLKNKAQVSAPFEVLVAVVIMSFVILAGTYALQNLQENTCLGDKQEEMNNIVTALKDVVLGSELTYRTITINSKPCYDQEAESIKLNQTASQSKCQAYCGGGSTCMLLEYNFREIIDDSGPDDPVISKKQLLDPICTNLPNNLIFETSINNCVGSEEEAKWETIDPTEEKIENGTYKIFRTESSDSGVVTVCFLKKTRH